MTAVCVLCSDRTVSQIVHVNRSITSSLCDQCLWLKEA
jgi:hypothetical protein